MDKDDEVEVITSETSVVVRQPYQFTKRFLQNRITPAENRVMIKILEKIKHLQHIGQLPPKTLFENREFYFDAKDLVLYNNTDKLENILKRLQSRTMDLPSIRDGEDSIISYTLFSRFERKVKDIGTNKGKVYLCIDNDLFDYILNLSKGYTQFLNQTAFNLSNSYAIKMYYHICHWFKLYEHHGNSSDQLEARAQAQYLGDIIAKRFKCKNHFSVEELKKEFVVPENYLVNDIKRRILDPAKAELDKKAEVSFNYSEQKEGRKTVAFSFAFYRNIAKDKVVKPVLLSDAAEDFLQDMAKQYQFTPDEKNMFVGILKRYGFDFVLSVYHARHREIKKYTERKKNPKTFCEAIGIICEGERKNRKLEH